MSRVKVTFEMEVHDFPHRNPVFWDWSSILEDDAVDTPDWSTLTVDSLETDGVIAVGVIRYDFEKDTIDGVYGGEVSDEEIIREVTDLVEPEGIEWKVYR
jgi:hypothetical protein